MKVALAHQLISVNVMRLWKTFVLLMNGLKHWMDQKHRVVITMVDGQAGKGSKYRKVNEKKYAENWERAFGKKTKKKKTKKKGKSK